MRHLLVAAIYISAYMLLSACSPASAPISSIRPIENQKADIPVFEDVQTPEVGWITEDGGQSQLDFNPQLDILFVTDNSESMKPAQDNLFKNIESFTRGIVKNPMIDYHIGVISTWDSSEAYAKANAKNKFGIGDLRYIKDANGKEYNRRYVIKTDPRSVLASTLKIGAVPLAQGGPEHEEFFSPLWSALDKAGHGGVNDQFFRDDAQLVVIFLTDADDSSKSILPSEMAQKLLDFKKGQASKLSVYGVLVRKTDDDSRKDWALRVHVKYHPECFDKKITPPEDCKTGFGPKRIEQMIIDANANEGTPDQIRAKFIMPMFDQPAVNGKKQPTFGERLAKVGDDITFKTLEKEIFLSQKPRIENNQLMIRVRYGSQVIPQAAKGGWLYNADNNSVVLPGDIAYVYEEGARFTVELVPLNLQR